MTSAQAPFPLCTGCAILKPGLTFGCDLASGSCGGNMVPGKCCVFIPATVASLGSISVAASCGWLPAQTTCFLSPLLPLGWWLSGPGVERS